LRARPCRSAKRQGLPDAAIAGVSSIEAGARDACSLPRWTRHGRRMPRRIGVDDHLTSDAPPDLSLGGHDRLKDHVAPPVSPWQVTVASPASVDPVSVPVNVAWVPPSSTESRTALPATVPVSRRAGVRQSESWNSMDPVRVDPCCCSVRSIVPCPAIPTRSHCPVQLPDRSPVDAAGVVGASEGVGLVAGVGGTEDGDGGVEPALLLQPARATMATNAAMTLTLMVARPRGRHHGACASRRQARTDRSAGVMGLRSPIDRTTVGNDWWSRLQGLSALGRGVRPRTDPAPSAKLLPLHGPRRVGLGGNEQPEVGERFDSTEVSRMTEATSRSLTSGGSGISGKPTRSLSPTGRISRCGGRRRSGVALAGGEQILERPTRSSLTALARARAAHGRSTAGSGLPHLPRAPGRGQAV